MITESSEKSLRSRQQPAGTTAACEGLVSCTVSVRPCLEMLRLTLPRRQRKHWRSALWPWAPRLSPVGTSRM